MKQSCITLMFVLTSILSAGQTNQKPNQDFYELNIIISDTASFEKRIIRDKETVYLILSLSQEFSQYQYDENSKELLKRIKNIQISILNSLSFENIDTLAIIDTYGEIDLSELPELTGIDVLYLQGEKVNSMNRIKKKMEVNSLLIDTYQSGKYDLKELESIDGLKILKLSSSQLIIFKSKNWSIKSVYVQSDVRPYSNVKWRKKIVGRFPNSTLVDFSFIMFKISEKSSLFRTPVNYLE